jgi:hypothetical protein
VHAIPWEARDFARDGNVPGPVLKVLSRDPATGATTRLLHLPPGWHDHELDWHPTVEEAFRLVGWTRMGGELLPEGNYLYRPPGVLHGPVYADPIDGMTSVSRMDGESRIFRYSGNEFPHKHAQPITNDHERSPYTWYERLDTTELPWVGVSAGPWDGVSHKWVNRHRETGGGVILLRIPAGWDGSGTAATGAVEEFVVEGTLEAGRVEYREWGYACRAAGTAAGRYASETGARLICWWDVNELE